MEEDDEFGDLYTDVLRPFQSSSTPQPAAAQPKPLLDLNINSDDEEILYGAPNSNPKSNPTSSKQQPTAAVKSESPALQLDSAGSSVLRWNLNLDAKQEDQEGKKEELSAPRVSEARGFENHSLMDESGIDVVVDERDDKADVLVAKDEALTNRMENFVELDAVSERRDDKDDVLVATQEVFVVKKENFKKSDVLGERDVKGNVSAAKGEALIDRKENFSAFDIEEADPEIGDMGSEPVIPGLSILGTSDGGGDGTFGTRDEDGEGDDWDSDSEDDLQIVLNDDNDRGLMGMNTGVMGSDDEDEDGVPLVILPDSEPGNQSMEEQEWGEDAAQAADGERKDVGDAAKVSGGVAVASKIGFSNHAYHPYHSHFKYVRPGAAPMPGAAPVGPGGAPGQVRPPVTMGPIAGRGRGEWRPPGIKSFHSGFGVPGWGNNASGRGFGIGLDFTLPSHKTIFEIDVDSFEEKPWKLPGIDVSDFFNFGLNEESWKDYCKQLEQLRLETSMQSKIRVYESGRAEQEYDPDLPPELAAAAGIKDISSENANVGKIDAGHSDAGKEFVNVRPQLPTGRPIQVEAGCGERLPSIDTRPPRIRDSDAIIEIVLQDSENDDSLLEDEAVEQHENDLSREGFGRGHESEGNFTEENGERDRAPRAYNGRKTDDLTEGDGTESFLPEARSHSSPDTRGRSSSYPGKDVGVLHEERRTKGRTRDRSPNITRSGSTLVKREPDSQNEDSVESIGGKHSPRLSSPVTNGSDEELDIEHADDSHDELVLVDGSSEIDREERAVDTTPPAESCIDENPSTSVKKQKVSSRVQQSSLLDIDDGGELRAAKSVENRKARSGSERDYQKSRGSVEEDVISRGRPKLPVNLKRSHVGDEQILKTRTYDERHEMGKHRLVETSREDPYSYRDWDPYGRKERDGSEGHDRRARAENTRKRALIEEMGSRHRNKVTETERMDKDEYFKLKKHTDNGNSRGYHDKDAGLQHRGRDDSIKSRFESMDDLHRKRRKEEEYLRRDAEKEEIYLGHRENTHHRKRERDDSMDLRKREGRERSRDDGNFSIRYKEEEWILWERGERHRIKQSHEESLPKRERVEGRDGVRSGRAIEDKAWVSQARVKDKVSDRDYQFKDIGRHSEQLKRRDRIEDVGLLQHKGSEDVRVRGDQLINDERRQKQERGSTRSDRPVSGPENSRVHHKKHKEHTRKGKEYEGGEHKSMASLKRNQEDHSGQMREPVMSKGPIERGKGENEILLNHQSSRKHKEDAASSDDEHQDSRRGRSKLERWTSHKERDFSITTKKSSSLKVKEIDNYNNDESTLASKLPDGGHHSLGDQKDAGDLENKNVESKSMENKHLDTVEKLKKRSERFKLPMPSEKEAVVIKKMENEPLPSAQDEASPASEIKPERPARKRRWISN